MSGVRARLPSVLFVDEAATRLAFMAEHVARQRVGDLALVASAGYDVRESHASPRAVAALNALGALPVDAYVDAPRRLRDVDVGRFDLVVAMSRTAAERVPRSAWRRLVVWSVPDPWQGSDDAYVDACTALGRALDDLLAAHLRGEIAA
jgi:protein-tyrosine-phosphatase